MSSDNSLGRAAASKESQESEADQVELVRAQIRLQDLEAKKTEAELKHLAHEDRNIAVGILREYLRLVFDVGLAILGLGIIIIVGSMAYSAARSQSVVVDTFSVPPSFNDDGETGSVVARNVLNQLQALQDETRGAAQHRQIEDAWSKEIKINIPSTGVSLSDLLGYLRVWLGDDIHIGGEVVQRGGKTTLSIYGSNFAAKTFSSSTEDDLPKLIAQAAEYVYGEAEPYLYSAYLQDHGRDADSLAFIKEIYGSLPAEKRNILLNSWGNALIDLGHTQEAIEKYQEAVRAIPDNWAAYSNIINAQLVLGQEEAALQSAEEMERATARGTSREKKINSLYYENQDQLRLDLMAQLQELADDEAASRGLGTANVADQPQAAQAFAMMHENHRAELELETSPGRGDPYVIAETAFVRGLILASYGEYDSAYRNVALADEKVTQSSAVAADFASPPACLAGWLAEMTHKPVAVADAYIKHGGHYVACYRSRADITEHRGNWPLAQKQYAEAVALAPSLPSPYFSWGEALMRHDDYASAIGKFGLANEKGPHWADPLKRWGDALVRLKRTDQAMLKYEQAAKYAPRWGGLYLAWGHALDYAGKHVEAIEKYRLAQTMDLTGSEHWTLRHTIRRQ